MSQAPRFCSNCGTPLAQGARFCGNCRHPVQPIPDAPPPPPPPAQAPYQPQPAPPPQPGEPIVDIIPNLRQSKGFLGMGSSMFNLIVTPGRLVFAAFTNQMMKEAVKVARTQAKEQGKGFFGQWGAQLGWSKVICQSYYNTPIDTILAQNPGSFFVPNRSIKKVRVREDYDEDSSSSQVDLEVQAAGGKYKFQIQYGSARDIKKKLGGVLGRVVK